MLKLYPRILFVLHEDVSFGLVEIGWYAKTFYLGGSKRGDKVVWVEQTDVFKAKMIGGLGVNDLRPVNLLLLSKWR